MKFSKAKSRINKFLTQTQERVPRSDIKNSFLVKNLQCPSCHVSDFKLQGDDMVCNQCQWRIENNEDKPFDFLDDSVKERFNIVHTENISDHPYDGNAII